VEYRSLGLTDLHVSPLCLGSMQFGWTADENEARRVLSASFEAGVNFIDTADVYSRWVEANPGGVAEEIIGRWWKRAHIARDKIILATKVRANMGGGPQDEGLSRTHIVQAIEHSLHRLQTDYVDLYQAHSPDEKTPIEETLRAFDDLIGQGKVRYLGASNYRAWQLMQALWTSDQKHMRRFDCLQPHYNLVHRAEFERELAEVCRKYSIGVIPYSPLGGGFLSGKYRPGRIPPSARAGRVKRYFNKRNWTLLDKLRELARHKRASPSRIALAWLLANPLITSPIIGPNSLAQLKDNLGAIDVHLTAEEKADLDMASLWKEEDR
jgi:aryl-alcohol dehydrogenase-like predicted oxidoreductase